ncbi:Uncharacterized protein APZ42_008675, partial [Daphnia magna]
NVWGPEKTAKYVDKFEVRKVHLIRKVSVITSTNDYSRILNKRTSIGDIADREIIDVIGIFYKKKKKVIPLQSYTKEEHSIKILDDKGKKME